MTATVPQVLRDAADLIERDGWHQGDWWEGEELCIDKAITHADSLMVEVCVEAVKAHLDPTDTLYAWNDAPGRTEAEVLAALRGAADAWEAAHEVETMTRVATGQSIGDEPWDHPGEPIAMSEEAGDA